MSHIQGGQGRDARDLEETVSGMWSVIAWALSACVAAWLIMEVL